MEAVTWRRHWLVTTAVGLALTAGFAPVYYAVTSHFAPLVLHHDNVVYGADDNSGAIETLTFKGDIAEKHLLYSPVMHGIQQGIQWLTGSRGDVLIVDTMVAAAVLNFLGAYVALAVYAPSAWLASALAVVYGACFANLVVFCVPETYVVANFVVVLTTILLARYADRPTFRTLAALGVACGLAALANPPLILLLVPSCIVARRRRPLDQFVRTAVSLVLLSGLTFVGAYLYLEGPGAFLFLVRYSRDWADLAHLWHPRFLAGTATSFLFYSVQRPLVGNRGAVDPTSIPWKAFLSPAAVVLAIIYLVYMTRTLARAVTAPKLLSLAWLVWIGAMTLFYVYFNPHEAPLYSTQCLLPLALVIAQQFRNRHQILSGALIGGYGLCLLWHNISPLI